jgi:hypothetical protein
LGSIESLSDGVNRKLSMSENIAEIKVGRFGITERQVFSI